MYTFDFAREVFHGDMFGDIADVAVRDTPTPEHAERIRRGSGVVFCKTDYVSELFAILRAQASSTAAKYVLLTHNSDYRIDANLFASRPESVVRWYALNVDYAHPALVPLPSGMERPLGGGYSARPEVIARVRMTPPRFRNLVYVNHNDATNQAERGPVTALLKDQPWVTYRRHGQSFDAFIDNCHNHKFVVSPPGNGIDCHRTWETLWCDSIPIVKRSVLTTSFADLPMLIVDDWRVLNPSMLTCVWEEFQRRTFDCSKLTFSYWKRRILDDRAALLSL